MITSFVKAIADLLAVGRRFPRMPSRTHQSRPLCRLCLCGLTGDEIHRRIGHRAHDRRCECRRLVPHRTTGRALTHHAVELPECVPDELLALFLSKNECLLNHRNGLASRQIESAGRSGGGHRLRGPPWSSPASRAAKGMQCHRVGLLRGSRMADGLPPITMPNVDCSRIVCLNCRRDGSNSRH